MNETYSVFHPALCLQFSFNQKKVWVPWGFGYEKSAVALEEDGVFPEGAGRVCAW